MAKRAAAMTSMVLVGILVIWVALMQCAGCGSFGCTERLSWEPPGGVSSAGGGLYNTMELAESEHITVDLTLLETQVEPAESALHIYNRCEHDVIVKWAVVAYRVEGQVVPLIRVKSWDPNATQQPVMETKSKTVHGILGSINPLGPGKRARIHFYYDLEDSKENMRAELLFRLEYEVGGQGFQLSRELDLVKFIERYACLLGTGTPKQLLRQSGQSRNPSETDRPLVSPTEARRNWVEDALRNPRERRNK